MQVKDSPTKPTGWAGKPAPFFSATLFVVTSFTCQKPRASTTPEPRHFAGRPVLFFVDTDQLDLT